MNPSVRRYVKLVSKTAYSFFNQKRAHVLLASAILLLRMLPRLSNPYEAKARPSRLPSQIGVGASSHRQSFN